MMISKEEAITQFKQILSGKTSWVRLAKSQFVNMLSIFQSWALRDALWKIERTQQEFFLSTALNDSSVLAHAEDREYIPRKATPSSGLMRIANNGTAAVAPPANTAFVSEAQLDYLLETAISIPAGGYVDVKLSQLKYAAPRTISVSDEMPFIEVTFSKEDTAKLSRFQVLVDGEPWEYARLFQNSVSTSEVYDEFFAHNGQFGIRFGNGIFGKIPTLNSVVTIESWHTEGATVLLANNTLHLAQDILDFAGAPADLTITTLDAITGGDAMEAIEEMRVNLHYWPRYNDKLVWRDDYAFFARQHVPGITWFECWGEQQQEAQSGFNVQNINKIFLTGYAPDNANLDADILAAFSSIPLLNRKFDWVAPVFSTFTVAITGKVVRSANMATAIAAIWATLNENYGKDSKTRKDAVELSDIYEIIKKTGFFDATGTFYHITITGVTTPTQLQEMVHLDPLQANSTFTLNYA